MRATLESRKAIKLNWFKQENVPFQIQKSMDWSYTLNTVQNNEITRNVNNQYTFLNIQQPIPETNIILFENELPQCYLKTTGSVGDKFQSDKTSDTEIEVIDRIVKVDTGETIINTKPPLPHEAHRYKEIQIHERKDKILRKLTFKNKSVQIVKAMKASLIETKEIRFLESSPAVTKKDPPEYHWIFDIPPEGSFTIEISLESFTKSTYSIEKEERRTSSKPNTLGLEQINEFPNI
jgi:hydroxyacyl-ACP dehydratase HTD2-like protein with hotdog domain